MASRDGSAASVAALYVETNGVYFGLDGVDPWDEERDARLYNGPHPVVAHPPCTAWSIMGQCRPEIIRGDDDGCFAAALDAVRHFGGVLEHPRYSQAWQRFGLPRPASSGWTRNLFDEEWTCEVDQGHYGHDVSKPTWLVYVGDDPPPLKWGRSSRPRGRAGVSHHGGGRHDSERGAIRSRTPPPFRDVLLAMARSVRLEAVA